MRQLNGPGETAIPDNLTPEQRRKTMQAAKGRDTSLEKTVSSALHKRGLRYRRCVTTMPGKPDFVLPRAKVAVFVDGFRLARVAVSRVEGLPQRILAEEDREEPAGDRMNYASSADRCGPSCGSGTIRFSAT